MVAAVGNVAIATNGQNDDPTSLGLDEYEDGLDELVFYDITASAEGRPTDIEMVREVAKAIRIPFAVGGGISSLDDFNQYYFEKRLPRHFFQ